MGSQSKSLTTLLQQSTIDDHEEILKACHNSLKQSKADVRTQHVRFLALLKLDRYEDALQVLDEAGDQLKKRTKTETAYALYKSGQVKEAIDLAKTVENDRGARHVEAQAVSVLSIVWASCSSLISLTVLKSSPMLPKYTKALQKVVMVTKTKKAIFESTAVPQLLRPSGAERATPSKGESIRERIWRLS